MKASKTAFKLADDLNIKPSEINFETVYKF